MITFVLFVLAIGLLLYTLLGGADFGAGVLEIFMGRKSIHTISKAIAPVWEANHVWLILVIVIIFNGFPKVYATLSLTLHIPLMVVLIGIIFRGTAFTFRHYDVQEDNTHRYYHFFFRASSVITPLFLGIMVGAMMLGEISLNEELGFYQLFIAPWLNSFCIAVGIFSVTLFTYLAAVFLLGEVKTTVKPVYARASRRSLLATILASGFVFLTAELKGLSLFEKVISNPISILAILVAIILIPVTLYYIKKGKPNSLRIIAGLQTVCALVAWAVVHYPVFIYMKDGTNLSIMTTAAPPATFTQLVIALIVGSALIFPALYFLFRVFKFQEDSDR